MIKTMVGETTVTHSNVDIKEIQAVINYLQTKYGGWLEWLDINTDGEFEDLKYRFKKVPFERIRRITGYLTGTTDTWNPSKTAELKDRVTHSGVERLGEK